MTTKFEEIILEEIFKLSSKIDKIQDEMKGMATKDDLKALETRLEKRMDKKFEQQTKDFIEMFDDSFKLNAKYRQEMKEQITKETDQKIERLREELLCKRA